MARDSFPQQKGRNRHKSADRGAYEADDANKAV